MNSSGIESPLSAFAILDYKLFIAALMLLMGAASMAYGYYSALPSAQHEGDVTYITGGIGDEERTALESVSRDYNLHITSAGTNGAYTGDTTLAIYDRLGNQVLMREVGPLFYASLPPGKYTISAENGDGARQNHTIKVSENQAANIKFLWK
jgi:hypothetical protein